MNILREYTLDYIRRNKKSSLTIMVAILMACILLNSVCLCFYNMWKDNINGTIKENGNWHGELFGATYGRDLNFVKAYASVEEVMIKGKWYVAKVQDEKRPYLVMRDADQAYWDSMTEKTAIIEGRIPKQKGEIAVSKQFTQAHREINVGDTITLPIGERISGKTSLDHRSIYNEGEIFKKQGEETFTIVGILDMITSSSVPAYTGIGYLEHKDILPSDDLTVYIRFKNMRDTYKELPKIAEQIGYTKDEYGNYLLKYNSGLLSKYFVFPERGWSPSLVDFSMPIVMIVLMGVLVSVFVFIIHNAFELSMQSRRKQLGMFKSIGATPKQIRSSITFEALLLAIIPILLGMLISIGICYLFFEKINIINTTFGDEKVTFLISPIVESLVIVITFFTAWLSAYIPSRKIAKKMPIEILRGELSSAQLKVKRRKCPIKLLPSSMRAKDIYADIAANNYKAYKKSFRVSTTSLTLSFLLLMICLSGIASGNLVNDIYYYKELKSDISLTIEDGNPVDAKIQKAISQNDKIKDWIEGSQTFGTIWIEAEDESEEIKAIGGLEKISSLQKYYVIKREEKYRIRTRLVGLSDETFKAYCKAIGTDWQDYYDAEDVRTIVFNEVTDTMHSTKRKKIRIPFLKLEEGEVLRVSEKVYDEDLGNYEQDTQIGKVTNRFPNLDIDRSNYSIIQFMPMSIYQNMLKNFNPEKASRAMGTDIQMGVEDEDISEVSLWLEEICSDTYSTGDYRVWNRLQSEEADKVGDQITEIIILFISGLFATIGISNAFCTVYTSLEHRSRTFAILRSVGVTPQGIHKLLVKEAIRFVGRPIGYATVVEVIFLSVIIHVNESSWGEFIPYLPIESFLVFTVLIILSIVLAYFIGSHKIRKQNIVEAVTNETI